MQRPPDVLVICGGVQPSSAHTDWIELDTGAPPGAPSRVKLNLAHITSQMVADLPGKLTDLLEIAAYVYCADQLVPRDTPQMQRMGTRWRRRLRFRIPVREAAFWRRTDVTQELVDVLSFLSEDTYSFEFAQSSRPATMKSYLDFETDAGPVGFVPDRVMLFSGGLDSFAGAVEALLRDGKRVALVSHQASPMVMSKQSALVSALRATTARGQLFHVGVTVNMTSGAAREFTQRSRSFLFATLAFVVARLFRCPEIHFFENGVVSLNLPLAEHVLGARSTRTTHPLVLRGLTRLFSVVAGEQVNVVNPYFWLTKADVVRRIVDVAGPELIQQTFSCVKVREATKRKQHCGVCSQCVDRRFGVLAVGEHLEPADLYAVDLFRGPREPGLDLTLVESYLLTASKFVSMTETAFLSRYGQVFRALPHLDGTATENSARLHQLHVKHGRSVMEVLSRELKTSATLSAVLELPPNSLLSLVQSAQAPRFVDTAETEPAASVLAAVAPPILPRPITFAVDAERSRIAFGGGPVLKGRSFDLICALLPFFEEDAAANCSPAAYRYVPSKQLGRHVGLKEEALRQLVRRTRKALEHEFREHLDCSIDVDDVVQNLTWQGYRLNPHLAPKPLAVVQVQARPTPARDVTVTTFAENVTTRRSRR